LLLEEQAEEKETEDTQALVLLSLDRDEALLQVALLSQALMHQRLVVGLLGKVVGIFFLDGLNFKLDDLRGLDFVDVLLHAADHLEALQDVDDVVEAAAADPEDIDALVDIYGILRLFYFLFRATFTYFGAKIN